MEEYGKNEGFDMNEDREEVYSKAVNQVLIQAFKRFPVARMV